MTPIDDNHYTAKPDEVITVSTHVNKLPFLCGFSDPPSGSKWENIVPDGQGEQRSFRMPAASSAPTLVTYVATYAESIAAGDPDPKQTYAIVISGSAGGTRTSHIVLGQGSLPLPISYFFTKAT
ncbi:MAG: hypothetical protein ABSD98_17290 [Candidatus Korobacteraceae bacterium]|jgi:hypothetical protein